MSAFATTLQAFFTQYLIAQRGASAHTVASYRDTFRLLLNFAQYRLAKNPTKLAIEDLNAELIGDFLNYLESDRNNSARTRNTRLAAIHSLFNYAALRHPEQALLIQQVLAIAPKRTQRALVAFLSDVEVDALLRAPNQASWIGRRDHALMVVAITTGLRVSELTRLTIKDVELQTGAHLRCYGKGRKERITPLGKRTCQILRAWLTEHVGPDTTPVFPSRRGGALSRDAVGVLLTKYVRKAEQSCHSMEAKRITPHVLRHTCAMRLLATGIDSSVIALWLGHESVETTQIYLHADMTIKQKALERTAPAGEKSARFHAPDELLAYLKSI